VKIIWVVIALALAAFESAADDTVPAETEQKRRREIPASYYYELARVHQRYGMNNQAATAYEKAAELEKDPNVRGGILLDLTRLYIDLGENEPASKTIQRALEEKKNDIEKAKLLLEIAEIYHRQKNFIQYENILQKIIALDQKPPQRRQAKSKLLELYRQQHRIEELILKLQKLVRSNPADTESLEDLAMIYIEIERDSKKALPYLERLVEVNPGDRRATMQLGSLYKMHKLHAKAIALYEKQLHNADPKQAEFYRNMLIGTYLELNDRKNADKYADQLLADNPDDPLLNHRLAMIYSRFMIAEKAVPYYRKAIAGTELPRQKTGLQRQLAEFLIRADRTDEARKLLEEMASSDDKAAGRYAANRLKSLEKEDPEPQQK